MVFEKLVTVRDVEEADVSVQTTEVYALILPSGFPEVPFLGHLARDCVVEMTHPGHPIVTANQMEKIAGENKQQSRYLDGCFVSEL